MNPARSILALAVLLGLAISVSESPAKTMYWSSTDLVGNTSAAYTIGFFGDGRIDAPSKSSATLLREVRAWAGRRAAPLRLAEARAAPRSRV